MTDPRRPPPGPANLSAQTTSADKVCCFSNMSPYLDLLAPGSRITAGGTTMSGTSMAAPHVAGAAAVLKAAKRDASTAQVIAAMKKSGRMLQDPWSSNQIPRINVAAAAALLVSGGAADSAPPLAYVKINGGAATTASPHVTLSITMKDDSTAAGMTMCVSNTATCGSALVPYAPSLKWTLPAANGPQAVNVWLRDAAGNQMAAPATASIQLTLSGDGSVPSDPPSLKINATSPTSAEVSWDPSAAADADSGVAGFKLVYRLTTLPPVKCVTARRGVMAAALPGDAPDVGRFLVEGLKARRRYRFRLCSVDYAGNVSPGVTGAVTTKLKKLATAKSTAPPLRR
jgi:subtilisin family serine protease